MNEELEKYYEARFDMFASKGWKDLMEDAQGILDSIDTIDGKDTIEKLFVAKGEKNIITWLLNLKEESSRAFEDLKQE